jgi:hypothetical protein
VTRRRAHGRQVRSRPTRGRPLALLAIATLGVVGLVAAADGARRGGPRGPRTTTRAASAHDARLPPTSAWPARPAWRVADGTWIAPVHLRGHGGRLVVYDAGRARVEVRDAESGAVHWRAAVGTPGSSPDVRFVHLDRDGGAVVLDAAARTLYRWDADGAPRPGLALTALGRAPVLAGCVVRDGGVVLLVEARDAPLVHLAADGRVEWRRPLPWPTLRGQPTLSWQARAVPTADGASCLLAPLFGDALAGVSADGAVHRVPLPAPVDPPDIQRRRGPGGRTVEAVGRSPLALLDVAVHGDTVEVLEGHGPFAGTAATRLLLPDGHLVERRRLPQPAVGIAADGGGWILLGRGPTGATVTRWDAAGARGQPRAATGRTVGNHPGMR